MSLKAEKSNNSTYDFVATEVQILDNQLIITLDDRRKVMVPLDFYPKLAQATDQEVREFEIMPGGHGIEWEKLDYHLSVKGIVLGNKSCF